MFTGLIEDLGTVRAFKRHGSVAQLKVASRLVADDLQLGESIAVNGACLTVTGWDTDGFNVDVSPETLQRTTLGALSTGDPVNLERALRLSDRLGGHLVSGHIDAISMIRRRRPQQTTVAFDISLPTGAERYLVAKGSVAIDGISLTVNQVTGDFFTVMVIPHSLNHTTLQHYWEGSRVNIETDLLGRYVERLLEDSSVGSEQGRLSREFLAKNGFL